MSDAKDDPKPYNHALAAFELQQSRGGDMIATDTLADHLESAIAFIGGNAPPAGTMRLLTLYAEKDPSPGELGPASGSRFSRPGLEKVNAWQLCTLVLVAYRQACEHMGWDAEAGMRAAHEQCAALERIEE